MLVHEYHLKKDREVCPYNGKTARIKGLVGPLPKNFEVEAKREAFDKGGVAVYPLTKFDEYCKGFDEQGKLLGTKGRWNDLPSQLSLHSVKETMRYDRDLGSHRISFEVPVVGVRTPQTEKDNGITCNRSETIYISSEHGLTEYGQRILDMPKFDSDNIRQLNARFGMFRPGRPQWQSLHAHRLCHAQPNMVVVDSEGNDEDMAAKLRPSGVSCPLLEGVVIDLLRPRHVTHIGTLGSIPLVSWQPVDAKSSAMGWVVQNKPGWLVSFDLYISDHMEKGPSRCGNPPLSFTSAYSLHD
jgi:hypothetical protein